MKSTCLLAHEEEERRNILQVKAVSCADRKDFVTSLAWTPEDCDKDFSWSPVLFPVSAQSSSSCSDFCSWQYFSFSATKWVFFLQDLKELNKWWAASDSAQRPCPSACSQQRSLPAACSQMKNQAWILRQERVTDRAILDKRSCTPRRQWGKKLPSNPSYFFSETHPGLLHILAWKLAVKETRKRYHTLTSPRALIMSGHLTQQRHFKNGTVMKDLHDTAIANNTRALQGTYSGLLRSLPSVCSFMTWLCPSADRPLALRSFPKTQPVFLKYNCQLLPC